jgi:hypothetical protein
LGPCGALIVQLPSPYDQIQREKSTCSLQPAASRRSSDAKCGLARAAAGHDYVDGKFNQFGAGKLSNCPAA